LRDSNPIRSVGGVKLYCLRHGECCRPARLDVRERTREDRGVNEEPFDRHRMQHASPGRRPFRVPRDQPPAADMPPLTLLVLDALMDDDETVETMRGHGNVAPYGLALVGESHVLTAIRKLLAGGLIRVSGENFRRNGELSGREVPEPDVDDASLRRYWFGLTPSGWQALGDADAILEAYWKSHPIA
jgi:hypothetical protein